MKKLKNNLIGLDIETYDPNIKKGLGFINGYVLGLSVCDGSDSFYIPLKHSDVENVPIDRFKSWFREEVAPRDIIGANIMYDLEFLARQFDLRVEGHWFDIQIAERRLHNIINEFSENLSDTAIEADCSIGKTKEVVEQIIRPDRIVHYLTPQHNLSEELRDRVEKVHEDLKTVIIKGRHQEGMCKFTEISSTDEFEPADSIVDTLIIQGKPIYHNLCKKIWDSENGVELDEPEYCPEYNKCPFINQYKDAQDASLVIMNHNVLVREEIDDLKLPEPDLVVIDESFWDVFYEDGMVFKWQLDEYAKRSTDPIERVVLMHILNALRQKKNSILGYLRNQRVTKKMLRQACNVAAKRSRSQQFCGVSPSMSDDDKRDICKDLHPSPPVYRLLKCILTEFDMERDRAHSVKFGNKVIYLQYRRELKRYKNTPVLIIDADARKELIERCFGRPFKYEQIRVKMPDLVTVRQCHSRSFYTTGLTEPTEKQKEDTEETLLFINELIKEKSSDGKRVLVIAPMKIEELLQIPSHCASIHNNDFRGLDEYKKFDVCIVVGRNQMRIRDLERYGRGMFYDDEEALELMEGNQFFYEDRRYSIKNGQRSKSVQVQFHPDPKIDEILKLTRECELVQGIHRIRPLRADKPREVIILCNIPVDLEIDDIFHWKDFKLGEIMIEKMLKSVDFDKEVLPLDYQYLLHRFSDLWTNIDQIKFQFNRFLNGENSLSIYIGKLHGLKKRVYKDDVSRRSLPVLTR